MSNLDDGVNRIAAAEDGMARGTRGLRMLREQSFHSPDRKRALELHHPASGSAPFGRTSRRTSKLRSREIVLLSPIEIKMGRQKPTCRY
jgi:hypothetical protein